MRILLALLFAFPIYLSVSFTDNLVAFISLIGLQTLAGIDFKFSRD